MLALKGLLLIPLLLVAACTPTADSTSSATSGRPATTAAGKATSRSCRLPLTHLEDTGQPGGRYVSSFLSYPSGEVTMDPRGTFIPADTPNLYRSTVTPYLYGPGPTSYSPAASRWVPVGTMDMSPDGSQYAYAEPFEGRLHVVTATTGADRVIPLPAKVPYAVARYAAEGIYLTRAWEGLPTGLYLVELPAGRLTTIDELVLYASVQPGVAWLLDIDERDANPVESPYLGALPNELVRRDLKTGSTVIWLYRPGMSVEWLGVDSKGRPIVRVSGSSWVITAPEVAAELAMDAPEVGLASSRGVWFANGAGVFLLNASGGVEHLTTQLGWPAGECR
jgi:hypothetical protein